MLHITADANIPFAKEAFGALGAVRTLPARDITAKTLAETDVLLVRSVTRVDASLLNDTPIRFVGTATAGTDHVDADALRQRGVAFASAPGSNATSVVDWVLAALLAVAADRGERLEGRTLGVVGMGAVGRRLTTRAQALGLECIGCDPPLQAEGRRGLAELSELLAQSDIVTLHTPLTGSDESPWPTRGMIDLDAVSAMRPNAWLVNAARGSIVTAEAARSLSESRPILLDVWPNEPEPSSDLIEAASIATPHIAGYAWDGKVRGTQMLAHAVRRWARTEGLDVPDWRPALDAPEPIEAPGALIGGASPSGGPASTAWLNALTRRAYDIRADDARFRAALADATDRASAFAGLRRTYPLRRELSCFSVTGPIPDFLHTAVASGLGLSL